MEAVNLFVLTRVDSKICMETENVLSKRNERKKVKDYEYMSLKILINLLRESGITVEQLDGFFYSYEIEQLGKEFDLLKIEEGKKVLNIELKSQHVAKEKIEKQLLRNQYYLKHIASEVELFTFESDTKKLYRLVDDKIEECSLEELIIKLSCFEKYVSSGIEDLFLAKHFLISPLNTTEKFINGEYFLTQKQEEIKKEILDNLKCTNKIWGITGSAGTGKTLLLYDIAKAVAKHKKCCIVHCGMLCDGHEILKREMKNIDILSAKEFKNVKPERYEYIFIDEAQRIYENIMNKIIEYIQKTDATALFSYDYFQTLSKLEERTNIPEKLRKNENFYERKLESKIRTNEELASFIRNILDLKNCAKKKFKYDNVEVLYANTMMEAYEISNLYHNQKGYTFIEYTKSQYKSNPMITYLNGDVNTHKVIGQEFDNVLILMDDNFRYGDSGRLQTKEHPNPNYLFYKLFFQGVSRAREKICILIVGNQELFEKINNIKYENLG